MSFDKTTGFCFCERCGYEWKTKPFDSRELKKIVFIEPRSCAGCKSKVWNQPRVYSGKYISGTLARRFKPTGRAAAAQNVYKEIRASHFPDRSYQETLNKLLEDFRRAKAFYYSEYNNIKGMIESGEINDRYESGRARKKEMDAILRLYDEEFSKTAKAVCEFYEPHPDRDLTPEQYSTLSAAKNIYWSSLAKS
jgi:hypothetical protein